jgi:hypothetical protein
MSQTYYVNYPKKSRDDILATAQGLISQNFDRQAGGGSGSIMVDGTAYFLSVGLRANDVVSNVSIIVSTAGATLTLSKVGLYNKAGTRLAVSADQGAGWETTGLKTVALASSYTVPADDGYYLAIVSKGTTLPTLLRGAANANGATALGTGMRAYAMQTGQTDLPASATFAATAPIAFWAAAS